MGILTANETTFHLLLFEYLAVPLPNSVESCGERERESERVRVRVRVREREKKEIEMDEGM